ncbi:MAG: metallophosphoesterase family protein [Acetobacteraceae bacterium]
MKFIHAADIHLDSPLLGLSERVGIPKSVVEGCTRRAFSAMIDLAIAEDVAFVVIAGDLFDGDWKDFSTGLFFAEEMGRLARPCFLLRGNHDARSIITHKLTLPPNVREFSSRKCETFELPEIGVVLHGHSFPNRAVPENLAAEYPAPRTGMINIGALHTSADDPGEHATYAPCKVGELTRAGYDYWALGHIHARRVLSEHPWIVFPGNLQGRHPKEIGAKGCTLVTIEDRQVVAVEHRSVDVLRWAAQERDITGADVTRLTGILQEVTVDAIREAEERPTILRLTLTGTTPLQGTLVDDTEQLAAECRQAALAAGGDLWVESVGVRTAPIRELRTDLLTPLRAAFFAGLDDETIASGLLKDFADLRRKLPAAGRDMMELPTDAEALRRLAEDAWTSLADKLATDEAT